MEKELQELYRKEFKFLADEYGFKRNQNLFVRVVGGEVIQTVCLIRYTPGHADIAIGLYSICDEIFDKSQLREGTCRLSDFTVDHCGFDPMEETAAFIVSTMKEIFTREVLPYICRINDIRSLIRAKIEIGNKHPMFVGRNTDMEEFKKKLYPRMLLAVYRNIPEWEGMYTWAEIEEFKEAPLPGYDEIFTDMFESYIKTGDFESAYKCLKLWKMGLLPSAVTVYEDFRHSPDKAAEVIAWYRERMERITRQKQALDLGDTAYLSGLVAKREEQNRAILAGIGVRG